MAITKEYHDLNISGVITTEGLTINGGYTFPTVDGSPYQVLATDGVGSLTFQTVASLSITSDDVIEGTTNLFFTDERVDDRVAILIQNGTGISWVYNDPGDTLTGNVSLSPFDTGDLTEGSNLYFTEERVDDRVSVLIQNGTGISWVYDDPGDTLTGTVSLSSFDTDDLTEGNNLYFTDERARDAAALMIQDGTGISWFYNDGADTLTPTISLSSFTTDDLAEGSSNFYLTDEAIDDRVSNLIQDTASVTWDYDNGANSLKATAIPFIDVEKAGVLIGNQPSINFIEGTDINLAVANNSFDNRIDVIISANLPTGSGTLNTIYNNSIQIGDSDIISLDFSDKFFVTEPSDRNILIDINMLLGELADVTLFSPINDGDIIAYNSSTGLWENLPSPAGSTSIYTGSGSLSGPTVVTTGSNDLTFTATTGDIIFNNNVAPNPAMKIDGATNSIGIGGNTTFADQLSVYNSTVTNTSVIGVYGLNTTGDQIGTAIEMSGVATTNTALKLSSIGAVTNYALVTDGSNSGFGTLTPTETVQIGEVGNVATLKFVDGNQTVGHILTSDANGVATWAAPAGGGDLEICGAPIDCTSPGPLDGDTLIYNDSTGFWELVQATSTDTNIANADLTMLASHSTTIGSLRVLTFKATAAADLLTLDVTGAGGPVIIFGDVATNYTFPPARGINGQILETNGSGILSWVTPSGGGGGTWTTITASSGTHSAAASEFIIVTNPACTITLPSASPADTTIAIKAAVSPTTMNIKTASGDEIDGTDYSTVLGGLSLTSQWEQISLISDGTDWFIY